MDRRERLRRCYFDVELDRSAVLSLPFPELGGDAVSSFQAAERQIGDMCESIPEEIKPADPGSDRRRL